MTPTRPGDSIVSHVETLPETIPFYPKIGTGIWLVSDPVSFMPQVGSRRFR